MTEPSDETPLIEEIPVSDPPVANRRLPIPDLRNPLDEVLNNLESRTNVHDQINRSNEIRQAINGQIPIQNLFQPQPTIPIMDFLNNQVNNNPSLRTALNTLTPLIGSVLRTPAFREDLNPPDTPIPDRTRIIEPGNINSVKRRLDFGSTKNNVRWYEMFVQIFMVFKIVAFIFLCNYAVTSSHSGESIIAIIVLSLSIYLDQIARNKILKLESKKLKI